MRLIPSVRRLGVALTSLLISPSAYADQEIEEYWNRQLAGWDGIVFACSSYGHPIADEVCLRIGGDFAFLAATSGIKHIDCRDCTYFEQVMQAHQENFAFPLYMRLQVGTTEDDNFVGGFLRLSVEADIRDYVCMDLPDCEIRSISALDVELYAQDLSFTSAPNAAFVSSMSDAVEPWMKELLTMYLRANP